MDIQKHTPTQDKLGPPVRGISIPFFFLFRAERKIIMWDHHVGSLCGKVVSMNMDLDGGRRLSQLATDTPDRRARILYL